MDSAKRKIRYIYILFVVGITILFATSLVWNIHNEYKNAYQFAQSEARASFDKDLLYRRWASMHGGVYVPVTDHTQPNPNLSHIPERDITSPSGKKLTLVNPAYMTRQVFEMAEDGDNVQGHITSLKPIRDKNKADEWEEKALMQFEIHDDSVISSKEMFKGQEHVRFMKPMMVEKSCLKCHAKQGYKLGDIRGGISVSVPFKQYYQIAQKSVTSITITYTIIYITIMIFSSLMYKQLQAEINKRFLYQNNLVKQKQTLLKQNDRITELNEQYLQQNDQLKNINAELEETKQKAVESDVLKTEFLNNLSHEIRTPLNGILGFSSFLTRNDTSENKRKTYGNIIEKSGAQLLLIIDDILEMAALGTKRLKLKTNDADLHSFMKMVHDEYSSKVTDTNLSFNYRFDENLKGVMIHIDEKLLQKIMFKLLDNAFKYTPEGFVEIGANYQNQHITIYVKDSGKGIKKEMQKKIFEPFSQEEKALEKKTGGLGLGLSIVKESVELLGASITLESEKHKGATFNINIPPLLISKANQKESAIKKVFNVLIAEDEQLNAEFLKAFLSLNFKNDIKISLAENGKMAVELFTNTQPDLILMDLRMPVMDGFEATKEIRKQSAQIPIIALTAYTGDQDRINAKNAGCNFFIPKPIDEKLLLSVINNILQA